MIACFIGFSACWILNTHSLSIISRYIEIPLSTNVYHGFYQVSRYFTALCNAFRSIDGQRFFGYCAMVPFLGGHCNSWPIIFYRCLFWSVPLLERKEEEEWREINLGSFFSFFFFSFLLFSSLFFSFLFFFLCNYSCVC